MARVVTIAGIRYRVGGLVRCTKDIPAYPSPVLAGTWLEIREINRTSETMRVERHDNRFMGSFLISFDVVRPLA